MACVAIPVGSTSLASFIASEVAISWLAGEIAKIMQLACQQKNMNRNTKRLLYRPI